MQLEVGVVLDGIVTGITKFGAFVDIGNGKTGMVHISEVAPTFVSEINDHLTENQKVKVKVIKIADDGKIALSIKKAVEVKPKYNSLDKRAKNTKSNSWSSAPRKSPDTMNFEDMMSKFKQSSDEKMSDLKWSTESKRGNHSRRGNGNHHK